MKQYLLEKFEEAWRAQAKGVDLRCEYVPPAFKWQIVVWSYRLDDVLGAGILLPFSHPIRHEAAHKVLNECIVDAITENYAEAGRQSFLDLLVEKIYPRLNSKYQNDFENLAAYNFKEVRKFDNKDRWQWAKALASYVQESRSQIYDELLADCVAGNFKPPTAGAYAFASLAIMNASKRAWHIVFEAFDFAKNFAACRPAARKYWFLNTDNLPSEQFETYLKRAGLMR